MSFLLFQIPRACGLNFICTITHVTQINVKWFVCLFVFSAIIKCRFQRVPVDFGPALEFRLTRRRSLSRFTGREDKFSYSRKILTVKRFVSSLLVPFFLIFFTFDVYRILGFYPAKANLLDAGVCFFDSLKYNNNNNNNNNDRNKNKWSKNSSYTAG